MIGKWQALDLNLFHFLQSSTWGHRGHALHRVHRARGTGFHFLWVIPQCPIPVGSRLSSHSPWKGWQ